MHKQNSLRVWYEFKQNHITRNELIRCATPIRKQIRELLEQGSYTDPILKVIRFSKNLLNNFDAMWTFLYIDDVEPTNNHGERCLRQSVIWRKKYFGTRSDYGTEFVARSASIQATCKLQSKNSFNFMMKSLQNYFLKIEPPSLIVA